MPKLQLKLALPVKPSAVLVVLEELPLLTPVTLLEQPAPQVSDSVGHGLGMQLAPDSSW